MPKLLIFILAIALSSPVLAQAEGTRLLADAQQVGKGRLTYFLWDVYDATLTAPAGEWQSDQPFALTLHYLRALDGHDIADRSVEEMRKLGFDDEVKLAAWHSQMLDIFPDVAEGSELTGLYSPEAPTVFFKDNQEIGSIHDPEFGIWFFNIWLSENTSEPELRAQLLGL